MTEALQQEIRTLKSVFESERDPEGRVFAPLADAYRRAGEVQQAVRLLNEGLARHPQFVPGHVVAAQLYVEQGLVEEAGLAARKALDLDGENVNALHSLLRVLEQNGDDGASDVRDRLVALDPGFQSETPEAASPVAAPPPLPDVEPSRGDDLSLNVEETVAVAEDAAGEAPPELDASGLDLAVDAEAAPEPDMATEEPLIDLDSLASVGSEGFDIGASDVGSTADVVPEPELPTEEPVLSLEDLSVVSYDEGEDVSAELEAVGDVAGLSGEGYEEPVMELSDLGPPEGDAAPVALEDLAPTEPETEEETITDLAALAPDEPVMELDDLAPETAEAAEDEPVALADLAPDPEDELVMDLADLAPDEGDEPIMDLADLAPDVDDEPVMDLSDLAPAEPEVEEEMVTDLAALAPDEPVMELDDLAPETAEAAEDEPVALADLAPDEDEEPVALADLAPAEEDELVVDLTDLAPEEDEEPVTDLADLAPAEPETEEEPVTDLAALAPDEPVMELDDLAPAPEPATEVAEAEEDEVTMVGLMAQTAGTDDERPAESTASDEAVVDMDALRPATGADAAKTTDGDDAAADATDEDDTAADGEGDDHEPGEPVYTRTLAELYVKQGAIGQAIEVYKHLASLDPGATDIQRRIDELLSGKGLEEQAEPVLSEETEEEVEALARELSEGGHGDSAEAESPYNLHHDAEEVENDTSEGESSGPTIGDYFEGLLGWKPGER